MGVIDTIHLVEAARSALLLKDSPSFKEHKERKKEKLFVLCVLSRPINRLQYLLKRHNVEAA
jgi:hypothetical protein